MKRIDLQIDEYLTEVRGPIKKEILNNQTLIIDSPTGSGKTFGIIEILRELKQPFIFLVSGKGLKQQGAKDYNLATTSTKASLKSLIDIGKREIIACFESFRATKLNLNLLDKYIIVCDESHTLLLTSHYRNNTGILSEIKEQELKLIILSATIQDQLEDNKLLGLRIESYIKIKSNKPPLNVRIIPVKVNKVKKWRENEGYFIQYLESKYKYVWHVMTKGHNNYKGSYYSGNATENQRSLSIVKDSLLLPGLSQGTNIFCEGINILNSKNKIALIIDYNNFDIQKANFMQQIARFRNPKLLDVYIYLNEKEYFKTGRGKILKQLETYAKRLNHDPTLWNVLSRAVPGIKKILEYVNSEWRINTDKIKEVEFILNGYKSQVTDFINDLGYPVLETIELDMTKKAEIHKKIKDINPKKLMYEMFLNETQDDYNDFGNEYFIYRLSDKEREPQRKALETNYPNEMKMLTEYKSAYKSFRDTLDRVVIEAKQDNKKLQQYFKLEAKEPLLTEQQKEAIKEFCLKLERDNRNFIKTRNFILYDLKVQWFPKIISLFNNQKMKKMLVEEIKINVKQDRKSKEMKFKLK